MGENIMSIVNNRIINIEELYKQEIRNLYDSIIDDSIIHQRGFLVPKMLKKDSILFLGINPSFTKNSSSNDNKNKFYESPKDSEATFYTKMRKLTKDINIDWTHFDILFIRETQQRNVRKLIRNNKYKNFFKNHLKISKKIIESVQPKIIVVSNTLARDLMGNIEINNLGMNYKLGMNYGFRFDDHIGTRIINKGTSLENTPEFFTSMLSGQRALDIGSYERLKWHIKYVITK